MYLANGNWLSKANILSASGSLIFAIQMYIYYRHLLFGIMKVRQTLETTNKEPFTLLTWLLTLN